MATNYSAGHVTTPVTWFPVASDENTTILQSWLDDDDVMVSDEAQSSWSDYDNITWYNFTGSGGGGGPVAAHVHTYRKLRFAVNNFVIPIVCMLGIMGNLSNFYIFYRRWVRKFMDPSEQATTVGLISLAISDAMFCLACVPAIFLNSQFSRLSIATMYYNLIKKTLVNLFLLTSTWLIVAISMHRLASVSWSLRMQRLMTARSTCYVHLFIFGMSALICVPMALQNRLHKVECFTNKICYYIKPWPPLQHAGFKLFYQAVWASVGTIIPLILLTYSNFHLVAVLCRSKFSQTSDVSGRDRFCKLQITALVSGIVMSFFLLVCPSMILEFLGLIVEFENGVGFIMAVIILNLLQAVKFASNFLFYCTFSRQFRRDVFVCTRLRESRSGR